MNPIKLFWIFVMLSVSKIKMRVCGTQTHTNPFLVLVTCYQDWTKIGLREVGVQAASRIAHDVVDAGTMEVFDP